MTFTFGSLFAGIGGFDLGLERAGMECRWQVEIDPYCQRVLEKHWPNVPRYPDVYDLSGSTLEAVDAICGGFPCQPVSTAGRRQGTGDERWLWPEYARLVGEIRPSYVIVENVPGLRTLGGYEVVSDLASLGYQCEWDHLSAQAVGAPHKRERFILVAYSDENRRGRSGLHEIPGESILQSPGSGGGSEHPTGARGGEGESLANPEVFDLWAGFRSSGTRAIWNRRFGDGGGPYPKRRGWGRDPAESSQSRVGRVAYGIPDRVDRLRALGNALVPQVAEVIGRAIMDRERELHPSC